MLMYNQKLSITDAAQEQRQEQRQEKPKETMKVEQRELTFPSTSRIYVQTTLAIIKPDVFNKADEIEDLIEKSGFIIIKKRNLQLSIEQTSEFYADQYGQLFFPNLTAFMSSGPIVAMVLAGDNAVEHWKSMMGPSNITTAKEIQPQSIRAIYGTSDLKNAVHGSATIESAVQEIKFMFPNTVTEPLPPHEETEEYLSKYVNPVLLRGLTELCKQKPLKPCMWLADWLLSNNPNQPRVVDYLVEIEEETKEGGIKH